jgi:hypothetical protein
LAVEELDVTLMLSGPAPDRNTTPEAGEPDEDHVAGYRALNWFEL